MTSMTDVVSRGEAPGRDPHLEKVILHPHFLSLSTSPSPSLTLFYPSCFQFLAPLCLYPSLILSLSLSLTHTNTHPPTDSLSISFSHTHTHLHICTRQKATMPEQLWPNGYHRHSSLTRAPRKPTPSSTHR